MASLVRVCYDRAMALALMKLYSALKKAGVPDDEAPALFITGGRDDDAKFDALNKLLTDNWGTRQGYREPSIQSTDD